MKKLFILSFFIQILILFSCQEKEENSFEKIIIWGLKDSISINENVFLSVKAIKGNDTIVISDANWILSDNGQYSFLNNILTPLKTGETKISCRYEEFYTEKSFKIVESGAEKSEYRIKNLAPPTDFFYIKEGNCGEAALWSICQSFGKNLSQQEINMIGGNPQRGLHGHEVKMVLDSLKIPYISRRKSNTWEITVDTLKNIIIRGNPIILGVKIYPDIHPEWSADHFVLLTGTNTKSNVFYFNDVHEMNTISYSKLINSEKGYSLINTYNSLYAIEIISPN
jgi:hypothetical protein